MTPLSDALRLALSAALAASKEARDMTERHAGKAIAIETMERRFVIHFEAGAARVEPGDGEADATLRGSPTAVLGALVKSPAKEGSDTAAVLGDEELFEDFRRSFRPHLPPSVAHFAEDASDAVRVGAQAAQSAWQGMSGAVRSKAKDYFPDEDERHERDAALAAQLEALKGRVDELERRLRVLEAGRAGQEEQADQEEQEEKDAKAGGAEEGEAP